MPHDSTAAEESILAAMDKGEESESMVDGAQSPHESRAAGESILTAKDKGEKSESMVDGAQSGRLRTPLLVSFSLFITLSKA